MATNVIGATKMGNTLPTMGFKPAHLAFRANVLPVHLIDSVMTPCMQLLASEGSADYYTCMTINYQLSSQ